MNDNLQIARGQILYIAAPQDSIGSEQTNRRPAIVVSNNKCNEYSPVIDVVYLTTQNKAVLPTHVKIYSSPFPSIALCEHPTAIDKRRIENALGFCSDEEMKCIDNALRIALAL